MIPCLKAGLASVGAARRVHGKEFSNYWGPIRSRVSVEQRRHPTCPLHAPWHSSPRRFTYLPRSYGVASTKRNGCRTRPQTSGTDALPKPARHSPSIPRAVISRPSRGQIPARAPPEITYVLQLVEHIKLVRMPREDNTL